MAEAIVSVAPLQYPRQQYDLAHQRATSTRTARVPASLKPAPRSYVVEGVGDCLAPEFTDGDVVVCDPDQPAGAGDFVVIWWRDTARQPLIKRLVYTVTDEEFEPAIVFEQLNPPRHYSAEMRDVSAVHKVLGKAIPQAQCGVNVATLRLGVPLPAQLRETPLPPAAPPRPPRRKKLPAPIGKDEKLKLLRAAQEAIEEASRILGTTARQAHALTCHVGKATAQDVDPYTRAIRVLAAAGSAELETASAKLRMLETIEVHGSFVAVRP